MRGYEMKKVVLITGASAGMGKEAAKLLLRQGDIVYVGARRVDKMKDLEPLGAKILDLDVTDEESMKRAVETVVAQKGKIDVLINNAGYGLYGALEDVSLEEAKQQFEVNVFGLARMTQLVIPYMRKNKSGKIINVSSMGGRFTMPLGGWYHSTKYAVEAYSDSLRIEVKPFGIDVILIEPGGIESEWASIAIEHLVKRSANSPYASISKKFLETMSKYKLTPTSVAANTLLKAANAKKPKIRYVFTADARLFIFLKWLLPARAFDKFIMVALKI
jgi:short-subunit dehydrogenase